MGLPRQKDAEPPPAFSMTLSRGLTNAAFVEDLEADELMARVRGDREESSRKEERRTNMRLARCLASWLVHTSTSKGRGRGQGLTPYPPTLRVARHQAAYPLPPYPKCPDATLPYHTLPDLIKRELTGPTWAQGQVGLRSGLERP